MGGRRKEEFSSDKSIVIDSKNASILQKLWDEGEFDKLFNSATHWLRITVIRGGLCDKDIVLRSVMNVLHSTWEIFPALYQVDGNDSFFLVRNGTGLVRKLALTGLKISHPSGKYIFDVSVTTNYLSISLEPLNVHNQLKSAFVKRKQKKTLDLTNISEDDDLRDIYFNLNVPQAMHFVHEFSRGATWFSTLVLQHNNIRSLENFDLKAFPHVTELDLRHNNITLEGFQKLIVKRGTKLNSIWLDGNPLCIHLPESEFIKKIEEVIPGIKKVDGIDVSNTSCGFTTMKNFIYDGSWAPFIDHFLHHYFMLMESPNRFQLARMYHQKATFSMSIVHDKDDSGTWSRMSSYNSNSRNLLTLSDITKAYTTLKIGPDEIIEVLNSLPVVHFDPDTFTVDVVSSQINELVMIDVGGVFQELNSDLLYFHRTFILTPFQKNPGEWKIETDMLAVSTATPEQIEKSFQTARRAPSPKMLLKLNPGVKSREALVPAVCELTRLTNEYATKILEESSWDLEMTLQAFIDQLKSNQIPMHAFTI